MIDTSLTQYVDMRSITDNIDDTIGLYEDYVDTINNYKKVMEADYTLNTRSGKSKVRPKMIQRLHNYSYSVLSEGILSDYNIVTATPKNESDTGRALLHQELLNYQLNNEIELDVIVDKASVYFEDFGSYYLKLGWDYKETITKSSEYHSIPEGTDSEKLKLLQSSGMLTDNGLIKVNSEVVTVTEDKPTIQLKEHNAIILGTSVDGSNTIDSLSFIADKYYITVGSIKSQYGVDLLDSDVDEVIGSVLDENKDLEHLFGTNNYITTASSSNNELTLNSIVVCMDYYTKISIDGAVKTVKAVVVNGKVVDLGFSPFGDKVGYPYSRGISMPDRSNKLYDGVPDTKWLDEDQRIIGAVTRGNIDTLGRTANGQVGTAKGFLDSENQINRAIGNDYEFNPNLSIKDAIHVETFPELSNSALTMLQISQNSMESMSGKKLFGEGLNSGSYGEVASGIKATLDATQQRMMSTIRRFNKPIITIVKKLSILNTEFITDDKIISLSDGSFSSLDTNSITANMDVTIEVSTPELDDKRANDLSFIVQTLGNTISSKSKNIILSEIVKLKGRSDLSKTLLTSANEELQLEQQRANEIHELETELLRAKIANEKSKGIENTSDAELNIAKVGTEQAKTRVLMATSDQKDLDFIRKKQGSDHKESLEKAKIEHNNALESKAFDLAMQDASVESPVKSNSYNKIPVTDLPSESLNSSDIIK